MADNTLEIVLERREGRSEGEVVYAVDIHKLERQRKILLTNYEAGYWLIDNHLVLYERVQYGHYKNFGVNEGNDIATASRRACEKAKEWIEDVIEDYCIKNIISDKGKVVLLDKTDTP